MTMKTRNLSLILPLAALAACAGPRREARVDPLTAPRTAPAQPILVEPLGCPLYAGDDRPDYDARAVACLVRWLQGAEDYLAAGGAPTTGTNAESIGKNHALARKLNARVLAWLDGGRPPVRRDELREPREPLTRATPADGLASQQHYLNGVVYYQQGDYEKAHAEWSLAVRLDPSNSDALAGLAKLNTRPKRP